MPILPLCGRAACTALALCLPLVSLAADIPDVRTLMTPEEFRAAGLGKLSPAEIEALNRWVIRYTAKDAPYLRQHRDVVREEVERVEADGIRSRIAGEFHGWDGKTVFRLENGQTWKQRLPGHWVHHASSPDVELRKNLLGFWMMRIVEADRAIGVKRID